MNIADILKKIRTIELRSKGFSSQVFSGAYKTRFKGRGMSFSEVRQYQYGDDIRNIDWNVTARTNEPHVKVFDEERELSFMFLIDLSSSSYIGLKQHKMHLAIEIAATLAFSAVANNDKVGAVFFSDKVMQYLPPQKGKSAVLKILSKMLQPPTPNQQTELKAPFKYLSNILKRRCTAFVLSDFMSNDYSKALKLAAKKHDVVGIQLVSQTDYELPKLGLMPFRSSESAGLKWLDADSKVVRNRYRQQFEAAQKTTQKLFLNSGAEFISLQCGEAYLPALIQFFKNRPML